MNYFCQSLSLPCLFETPSGRDFNSPTLLSLCGIINFSLFESVKKIGLNRIRAMEFFLLSLQRKTDWAIDRRDPENIRYEEVTMQEKECVFIAVTSVL